MSTSHRMPRSFRYLHLLSLVLLAAYLVPLVGCGNQDKSPDAAPTVEADDQEEHEHDEGEHAHPPHGPHGGHLVELEPAGFQVEWETNRDEDQVVVYLTEKADTVETVQMRSEIEGQEPETFELTPDEELGEGAYQVVSPNLMTAIAAGDAAYVDLIITTSEGEQTAEVQFFDH